MTSILSADDITALRALTESFYPDSAEVLRTAAATGGPRGDAPTEAPTGAAFPARLRVGGTQPVEREIAARKGWAVSYAIDMPYSTDVTPADRIRINGTRKFEVGGVTKGGTEAMQITAVCQEVG